ncbi:MAG: carboxynorspermidine decarboxylase [Elusimicrobia bacterium RIFCSPLOWO2_01_FULL_54_10]|nr:MAG: carboxynorspermidine decarboxylase [Elusimicrobia bacterium RIFCSPLOWO2_01_FULL_54_10]
MKLKTPYYLIDENKLLKNLKRIRRVKEISGAKCVLALKCFATWGVFPLMRKYMDGTTSSSLFEAKLGAEKFGKEVHAYSVAFSDHEMDEIKSISDKIIFNSVPQLERFYPKVKGKNLGLRVNPAFSYSHFDLADPARKYCKLGVRGTNSVRDALHKINGVMFHYNCENDDYGNFSNLLDRLGRDFGDILHKLEWVSLGGGFYFTKDGYPLEKFAHKLRVFSQKFGVQVYLEPGEAAITQTTYFVTRVVDIVKNEVNVAVVDSSVEAHMLDLLIYRQPAKIDRSAGPHTYMIAGKSCLAGDIFGTFKFRKKLAVGDEIRFADAAGYTMVKKNWFNGLAMPSIVVKKIDKTTCKIKSFSYNDFKSNLS